MSYGLGGVLPLSDIPKGTNMLVSGPPMSGKYMVLLDILGANDDDLVLISTHDSANKVQDDVDRIRENSSTATTAVIDCVSKQQGLKVKDTDTIKYISSPKNLTRIGVSFTDFYAEWEERPVRVGLHSLSHLLMYTDLKTVYKFTQVLTGQIYNADWMSVISFDPSMHNDQTAHTLQNPFDWLIETRVQDDERQLRVRGTPDGPIDWTSY